ncbi:MAG: hypothetical protein MHM6MM_000552 [Cercozoa sp. M6MM]
MSDVSETSPPGVVQNTANDALLCKVSCAAKGYIDDPFIQHLARQKAKRAPVINRGYFVRVAAFERLCCEFIESTNSPTQIVSLGAGLDSLYFRLARKYSKTSKRMFRMFEIDFARMTQHKVSLLTAQDASGSALREHLTDRVEFGQDSVRDERYRLCAGDLAQFEQCKQALLDAGLDTSLPTLFLSECVFIYMQVEHSRKWLEFAGSMDESAIAIYEQILPETPFGRTMRENLRQQRGIELPSYLAFPTLVSQQQRLRDAGFQHVHARDMNSVSSDYLPAELTRHAATREIFDEFEEFHLFQQHYMISFGLNKTTLLDASSFSFLPQPVAVESDFEDGELVFD